MVILDIRMPGKSGIDGLQEIRRVDQEVSVVMLTGFGALETAQQAIRLGANDYLKKPFDTREIMEIVRENVRRTRVERQRVHMAEDLRNLNTELVNEITVKEHMATLGHASAEFVHDLRNPLTVVHGYVQLLEEHMEALKTQLGEDSEEAFDYLNVIARNIQRCHEITEMWRNLGKETDRNREVVGLRQLVNDVLEGSEPVAAAAHAQMDLVVIQDPGRICAHAIQIFRALQNLVSNAIHALAPSGGMVRVTCDREGDLAVVSVEDNGCGMSRDQQEKIFEPYYTTKDLGKGTGLGLAITRKVIEMHGGRIVVNSTEGQGTVFAVRLPVHTST